MAKNAVQILGSFLVKQYQLTPEEAAHFVTALFDVIREGLERDKIVKVKGLGTFKVLTVKPRESVNVNTGERVTIEGHDKVTFTPDNSMKELVNRPFSQFETVIVRDGVNFDAIDKASEEAQQQATQKDERLADEPTAEEPDEAEVTEESDTMSTPEPSAPIEEKRVEAAEPTPEEHPLATEKPEKPKAPHVATQALSAKERFTRLMDESEPISPHTTNASAATEKPAQEPKQAPSVEEPTAVKEQTSEPQPQSEQEPAVSSESQEETDANDGEKIEQLEAKLRRSKCRTICCVAVSVVAIVLCSIIGFLYGKAYFGGINEPSNTTTTETPATPTQRVENKQSTAIAITSVAPSDTMAHEAVANSSSEAIDLDAANQYPSIRYGAYKIVGVEKLVLKKGQTMTYYCRRYFGKDMIGYFEAINGTADKSEGDTILVPQLKLK